MRWLYGSSAVKKIDRYCESELGIPVMTLMGRAADALYRHVERLRKSKMFVGDVLIVCGSGNNGGDGYALACMMAEKGEIPRVVSFAPSSAGEPARYAARLAQKGIEPTQYAKHPDVCEKWIREAGLIVDCIFGSSFDVNRPVYNAFARLCGEINQSRAFVLSADMPSGVGADDGTVATYHDLPCCVKADVTVSFAVGKVGLYNYPAAGYAGQVFLEDIDIPDEAIPQAGEAWLLDEQTAALLPKRMSESHKGTYGKLLLFCGSPNMTGAAVLATGGALRAGAGLVSCMGVSSVLDTIRPSAPEPIYHPLGETVSGDLDTASAFALLEKILPQQSAVLAGCGIGNMLGYGKVLVHFLKHADCPLVLDADGLNLLCSDAGLSLLRSCASRVPVIVTPHPAEMARLMGATVAEVQADRLGAAKAFSKQSGCTVVLKGAGTVIVGADGRTAINTSGNPGMAKGGMGDLLAGFIAGFAAQKIPPFEAACIGVYYHGKAGDFAKSIFGEYGLLPRDVEPMLGKAVAHSFKA